MKGISNFMAILLAISIVVTAFSAMLAYFMGYFGLATSAGQEEVLTDTLSSCMRIESAQGSSIFLRNCGSGSIKSQYVSVFVDDLLFDFSMTPSSIGKDAIGNITISLSSLGFGSHKVRITTKAAEVERYVNVTMKSGLKNISLLDLV